MEDVTEEQKITAFDKLDELLGHTACHKILYVWDRKTEAWTLEVWWFDGTHWTKKVE